MNPLQLRIPTTEESGYISYEEITEEPHLHFPRDPAVNWAAERNRCVAEGTLSKATMREYADAQRRAHLLQLERHRRISARNRIPNPNKAHHLAVELGELDTPVRTPPDQAPQREALPDGPDPVSVALLIFLGWAMGVLTFVVATV